MAKVLYETFITPKATTYIVFICNYLSTEVLHVENNPACPMLNRTISRSMRNLKKYSPLLICYWMDICDTGNITFLATHPYTYLENNQEIPCRHCRSSLAIIKKVAAEKMLTQRDNLCTIFYGIFQNPTICSFLHMPHSPKMLVDFANSLLEVMNIDWLMCTNCYANVTGYEEERAKAKAYRDGIWQRVLQHFLKLNLPPKDWQLDEFPSNEENDIEEF